MNSWRTTILVTNREVKLLVTDGMGDELMRARLPGRPDHPRSFLTLLEGIALWNGSPVSAAISVVGKGPGFFGRDLFGDVLSPIDSALVHLEFLTGHKPRRLRGTGSFRDVLRLHKAEVER